MMRWRSLVVAVFALAASSVASSPVAFAEPPVVLAAPPWIGVTMDTGSDIGVPVLHVVRGSPSEKAGMKKGDRIVAVEGARASTPSHVTRAVQTRAVGDTMAVEVDRAGGTLTLNMVLAARPSGDEILRMDLVGAVAPAWTNVTPLSGAPASLDKLRGKVVIIDFWASWCGPCRMLAPKLSALKDRFGAQGLAVVGITTDDAEKAAVFAERHQMRYGVVVDKTAETSKSYGIAALPTMLLVDKKGVIREVFVGYDPGQDARVESLIKSLIAEPAPR
jgi:thiol-disulfide isomerase/thioredoxin